MRLMTRRWLVGVLVVSIASGGVASAKLLLCPPGRFEMREGTRGGRFLRLADGGMVELEGVCPAARVSGDVLTNGWRERLRVRWEGCTGSVGAMRLRARFEDDCRMLRGVVRGGPERKTFTATRVPLCGDLLVSPGEDCDDGNAASGDCCVECHAEPGCYIPCERTADCAPQAICDRHDDTCRATTGICRPRYRDQCADSSFAVCGCDGKAYPTECAAWEAGVTVQGGDGLNSPVGTRCRCRPEAGLTCGAGRFCEMPYRCLGAIRPRIGGICRDLPVACAGDPGPPTCGCDGKIYRNDCERRLARVQKLCACAQGSAASIGARCGGAGPPTYGCDCSGIRP
jgi:cysteine-rich repeat protein